MRLTESMLRRMIKQEVRKAINEGMGSPLDAITRKIAALYDKTMAGGVEGVTAESMTELLKATKEIEKEIENL